MASPSKKVRVSAVLVGAFALAVVGGGITAWAANGDSASAKDSAAFADQSWKPISVERDGQKLAAPERIITTLEMDFGGDGSFGMSDGVNFFGGRYVSTKSGASFDLRDRTVTYVQYTPATPAEKLAIGAMDSAADPDASKTVEMSADGNMIISVDGYKLTLAPNGPAKATLPSATPTATS